MDLDQAFERFRDFVIGLEVEGIKVHQVSLALDERLDGEAVTRVLLLVEDPKKQTWDLESVTQLRMALARFATEIGLPPVSISLVPEAEAASVPGFAVR